MRVAQGVDQPCHGLVPTDQNTDAPVWMCTMESGNFRGRPPQCDEGLLFILVGLWCCHQTTAPRKV